MPIEGEPFTPEGELKEEVFTGYVIHRENAGSQARVDLDHQFGQDLEFSLAALEQRPRSFDTIQEFIVAAVEAGTPESMAEGYAAQLLRNEMHAAYVQDVPFRPSQDSEMRDELAEWLVGEVDGLSLESAMDVVSLEGLDFPPASEEEKAQSIETTDSPLAA